MMMCMPLLHLRLFSRLKNFLMYITLTALDIWCICLPWGRSTIEVESSQDFPPHWFIAFLRSLLLQYEIGWRGLRGDQRIGTPSVVIDQELKSGSKFNFITEYDYIMHSASTCYVWIYMLQLFWWCWKGGGIFQTKRSRSCLFWGLFFFMAVKTKYQFKSLPPPTDLTLTLPEIGQWLMVTQIRVGLLITQAYQTVETCKKQS